MIKCIVTLVLASTTCVSAYGKFESGEEPLLASARSASVVGQDNRPLPPKTEIHIGSQCVRKYPNLGGNKNEERVAKVLRVAGVYIDEAAAKHRIDCRLITAIIATESGGERTESEMIRAVSPTGARGLMQLLPSTARGLGAHTDGHDLYDPELNVHYGTKYFKQLLRSTHSLPHALLAYNQGPGRLNTLIANGADPRSYAYVRSVQSYARVLGYEV